MREASPLFCFGHRLWDAVPASWEMKHLIVKLSFFVLFATAWVASAPAAFAQADLTLNVTVITSEHSRDSNSTTKSLKVSGNSLAYSETYHGAGSGRRPPIAKEFKLTDEDRSRLIRLLKDHALLGTESITKPEPDGPGRDFELRIAARLAGKDSLISIEAPRSAAELNHNPLYQASVLLISELFKIINRTDPDITFAKPIG